MHYIEQDGKPVFKAAVTSMADVSYEIMERNGLSAADDISWLVPHQANLRIIDATATPHGRGQGEGDDQHREIRQHHSRHHSLVFVGMGQQADPGENLILSSFGGGFTWGSIWLKWAMEPTSKAE